MVNQNPGDDKDSQFNFFGKDCLDVTDVDAFRYGKLGSLFADETNNVFKSEGRESGIFDSAISYAWNNKTINTIEVTSGSTITGSDTTIPTPSSREGFVFSGWYTGENGTGIKLTEDFEITSDITFYAYWKRYSVPIQREEKQREPDLIPLLIDGVSYNIGTKEVKDETTTINIDEAELSKNIINVENGSSVVIPIS